MRFYRSHAPFACVKTHLFTGKYETFPLSNRIGVTVSVYLRYIFYALQRRINANRNQL